jgi:nucleoside-diphosphate-sugar epimerase
VTGSSGLLGRPLCDALRRNGHAVDEFDLQPRPGASRTARFVRQDVLDPVAIQSAVEGMDGVVHLAAVSRCAPAEAAPAEAERVNVGGTQSVLDALHRAGDPAWFILASSREVYGEVDRIPVDESFPVHPKAVYGRTKAGAEAVVRRAALEDPRAATVLRLTNLYGSPWDFADRVIPAFLSRARRDETLEVRGPSQVLDFLHVLDAVGAICAVTERPPAPGVETVRTLNIASGEPCTLRGLAERVVRVTASRSRIQEVAPAAWTPSKFVADISRARTELAWGPTISLDAGLADLATQFAAVSAAP